MSVLGNGLRTARQWEADLESAPEVYRRLQRERVLLWRGIAWATPLLAVPLIVLERRHGLAAAALGACAALGGLWLALLARRSVGLWHRFELVRMGIADGVDVTKDPCVVVKEPRLVQVEALGASATRRVLLAVTSRLREAVDDELGRAALGPVLPPEEGST